MNKLFDSYKEEHSLREKLIGIDENSIRKTYYPQLQAHIAYLGEKSEALLNMLEDLEETKIKLEASEARYRSIFENTGTASIIIEEDNSISLANAEWVSLSGFSKEENEGKSWYEYVFPDDLQKVNNHQEKVISSKSHEPVKYEFRFVRRNGEIRNLLSSVTLIPGTTKFIASMIDITERKNAELELRKNHQKEKYFSKKLLDLQEINNTLTKTDSFEDVCRKAVELGCKKLGFDRLSIWFEGKEPNTVVGSFGIDETGNLRDERNNINKIQDKDPIWKLLTYKKLVYYLKDVPLYNDLYQEVGKGDAVVAALWNGDKSIGFISVDNLLTHEPITEQKCEILAIYASNLGQLFPRKQAETALKESEKRFRHLADSLPQIVWTANGEGEFDYHNQRTEDYLVVSKEFTWDWEEILHPEDLQITLFAWQSSLQTGNIFEISHRIKTKNNSYRWFLSRSVPVINESGKIKKWFGTSTDIDERIKFEQKLNEVLIDLSDSEAKLKEAQTLAHLGSWELNHEDNELKWSDEVYRIFGLTPQEINLNYQLFLDMVHPGDRNAVNEIYTNSLENQKDYEIVHRIIRRPTGEIRIVQEKCRHVKNQLGEVIRSIGMVHDITEQKKAEDALRESEEKFRQLADSMPQLVWTANPNGMVDYYNSKVSEFDGIRQNTDGSWQWTPVLHDEDIKTTTETWTNAIKTGQNYEIIHRVKKRTGEFKWCLSRSIPERNPNGEITKWYGTSTDITEQKLSEQKLEETLMELKRSNKDLEQFAYTASHDLQEPIRMIKTYSQLLEFKNKELLDQSAKEYLNFISNGATRMQELVSDLLRYSRISTAPLEFEAVDLNLVMKDVKEDLKFAALKQNAIITVSDLPIIKGNRTQLRQLFQNFIQNAIKFRSERNPEININAERKGNFWQFSIRDNGIGIDMKFHERIFIIFQRLNDREKYEGTGMGLALCKKIIERHGGQVRVESEVGVGSIFYFTLQA